MSSFNGSLTRWSLKVFITVQLVLKTADKPEYTGIALLSGVFIIVYVRNRRLATKRVLIGLSLLTKPNVLACS